VLAILSKSVTVTLPAALLVVMWWQRGTLRWREDIVPLLPFFAGLQKRPQNQGEEAHDRDRSGAIPQRGAHLGSVFRWRGSITLW
jgi:hypothetical protein